MGAEVIVYTSEEAARAAMAPVVSDLERVQSALAGIVRIDDPAGLEVVAAARREAKRIGKAAEDKQKKLLEPFKVGVEGIKALLRPTIETAGKLFDATTKLIQQYEARLLREEQERKAAAAERQRLLDEAAKRAADEAKAEQIKRDAAAAEVRRLAEEADKALAEGDEQAAAGLRDMVLERAAAIELPPPEPAPLPIEPQIVEPPVPSAAQVFAAAPVAMRDNWRAELQAVELLILAAAQEVNGQPPGWMPEGMTLVGLLRFDQAAGDALARKLRVEQEAAGVLFVNRKQPVTR